MAKNYDEVSVVISLSKNQGIRIENSINNTRGVIYIKYGSKFVGNGTLGKIDFLVNYCNYIAIKEEKNYNINIINKSKIRKTRIDKKEEKLKKLSLKDKIKKIFNK